MRTHKKNDKNKLLFSFKCLRENTCAWGWERGREREKRIPNRLCTVSAESHGAQSHEL